MYSEKKQMTMDGASNKFNSFTGDDVQDKMYSCSGNAPEYNNILGLGNSKTEQLKDQFKAKYGSKWRDYWEVYKKNGGNKDKLSMQWQTIENFYKDYKSGVQDKSNLYRIGMSMFNPASILIRNGFLAAIRINFLGLAIRLYPAYLSDSELSKEHFDKENAKRAKEARKKIEEGFIRKLGGSKLSLQKAVLAGGKKKAAKLADIKGSSNFCNAEGVSTGSSIVAALGYIASILAVLSSLKVNKNPYETGFGGDNVYTGSDDTGTKAMNIEEMPTIIPTWVWVTGGIALITVIGGIIYGINKSKK